MIFSSIIFFIIFFRQYLNNIDKFNIYDKMKITNKIRLPDYIVVMRKLKGLSKK
jgi:hypothetical protein